MNFFIVFLMLDMIIIIEEVTDIEMDDNHSIFFNFLSFFLQTVTVDSSFISDYKVLLRI